MIHVASGKARRNSAAYIKNLKNEYYPYGGKYEKITYAMFGFALPGIPVVIKYATVAVKYVGRWAMKLIYSKDHIDRLILMSVKNEPELSVSRNRISPFSLEVSNSAPCDIIVSATARLVTDNDTDLAATMIDEPVQTIVKRKSKSFSIRPFEILKNGQQKVADVRSKSMAEPDYIGATLSVKAIVKTSIYDEIQISRNLALRIKTTN
jgi:hypothetical protein